MRAVRLIAPGNPLADVVLPDPEPPRGHVLVRISAAGICHSDAHYRAGDPATRRLPITLGHEIAGEIVETGAGVDPNRLGERVAVHYVVSDRTCTRCARFGEQFCEHYEMFGLTTDGGYAEAVVVPEANAVPIPAGIPDGAAAVMMCSSATSLHALRKGRLASGETVSVIGSGGLGMSAIQLALALGAATVYAVDIDPGRLEAADRLGAVALRAGSAGAQIAADGGSDVALILVDRTEAFREAMASLAPRGRLVAVGIARGAVPVVPYSDLIAGEHELIGSNDHLREELDDLFGFALAGSLKLDDVITERIPLRADAVNATLDRLDRYGAGVRTVIEP